MKRKICALGLTAALSISLLTTSAFAAEASFKDASGHWAEAAISTVVEKNLFNGTSEDTFSPDVSMSRGMFVTVLGRFAEGMGYDVSGTPAFSDVASDAYYAKYVAWGAANGIVNGVSETEFSPDADVTREQMCALFVRFLEFVQYPMPETGDLTFADTDQISSWAVDPVKTAVALGLIQGIETDDGMAFDPAGNATRAQVATVFLRLDGLDGIYDLKPVTPATPEDPAAPAPVDPAQQPANPSQPASTDPAGGGGGGGGGAGGGGGGAGGSKTVPVNTAGHTQDEIDKEEQIVGYLREMETKYENMSYINSTSQEVQDVYKDLMGCISDALNQRDTKGTFLTEDYIKSTYGNEIEQVRSAYKALDDEQNNEFVNVGIRLGNTSHTEEVMSYFGVRK